MPYVSQWKFARISARKARLLTDLIRNKPVGEALDALKFNKKRGAIMVAKVLKSAIANADVKEADVEELYVSRSFCNDGPIMKRFQPKDRGKSFSIFKRMCHITIEVEEGKPPMSKAKRKQLEIRRERLQKKGSKKTSGEKPATVATPLSGVEEKTEAKG
ncbi:MAG: 50S ribosomal protein L22 [Phycisphaerales bacterium]|nr:50S ribosomal protein L22 [Phycisphaerales bacterium]